MSQPSRYRKIVNPEGYTPQELLIDLQKRATHYASKAETLAKRKIRLDHRLSIVEAVLSVGLTIVLTLFHASILSSRATTMATIGVSAAVSLIVLLRRLAYDAGLSVQTIAVSQQFYEIREAVKSLRTTASVNHYGDEELRRGYEEINKRYAELRHKFVEYARHHVLYYGASAHAGRLRIPGE